MSGNGDRYPRGAPRHRAPPLGSSDQGRDLNEIEAAAAPAPVDARPARRNIHCPECGALNREGAQWCGQCLTSFAPERRGSVGDTPLADASSPEVAQPGAPGPIARPRSALVGGAGSETFKVAEDGIRWTCPSCDTENDFDRSACSVCGKAFADVMRPPEEKRPVRDPNKTALISLFFPGAGHAYLELWGQAIARGVISTWVVFVAVIAAAQGGPESSLVAGLFGLISIALWLVAAHDAYREATNEPSAVLLKPRLFLYLVLGLLMLSVVMFMVAALRTGAV